MPITCTLNNSVSHTSYQPNISVKIKKNKRKITETKKLSSINMGGEGVGGWELTLLLKKNSKTSWWHMDRLFIPNWYILSSVCLNITNMIHYTLNSK